MFFVSFFSFLTFSVSFPGKSSRTHHFGPQKKKGQVKKKSRSERGRLPSTQYSNFLLSFCVVLQGFFWRGKLEGERGRRWKGVKGNRKKKRLLKEDKQDSKEGQKEKQRKESRSSNCEVTLSIRSLSNLYSPVSDTIHIRSSFKDLLSFFSLSLTFQGCLGLGPSTWSPINGSVSHRYPNVEPHTEKAEKN